MKKILVTGAGGFIGFHLAERLKSLGYWVRAVDIKQPQYATSSADEFLLLDLRSRENCLLACNEIDEIYHLAADMGGIGYISGSHAEIACSNTLINLHLLEAARAFGASKLLFSSTACVYLFTCSRALKSEASKRKTLIRLLRKKGTAWEKLYMEKLCEYYREDYRLETRVVRFHNVYGPLGTYEGGREKVPAAICRKVAVARNGGEIEVWGDGEQTRSFLYIDDCVEGILRLMKSDYAQPLNLGSEEMVSINQLVDSVCGIANKQLTKKHDLSKPQGCARPEQRQQSITRSFTMGTLHFIGRWPGQNLCMGGLSLSARGLSADGSTQKTTASSQNTETDAGENPPGISRVLGEERRKARIRAISKPTTFRSATGAESEHEKKSA